MKILFLGLKELDMSSPHHALSGKYRFHRAQSKGKLSLKRRLQGMYA